MPYCSDTHYQKRYYYNMYRIGNLCQQYQSYSIIKKKEVEELPWSDTDNCLDYLCM